MHPASLLFTLLLLLIRYHITRFSMAVIRDSTRKTTHKRKTWLGFWLQKFRFGDGGAKAWGQVAGAAAGSSHIDSQAGGKKHTPHSE